MAVTNLSLTLTETTEENWSRLPGYKTFMFGLDSVFDLLSLFYAFLSVRLTAVIWREWSDIRQEPLTPRKKSLAEQASFFIAVPIGVFFHELGHALAVWGFGGRVVQFAYRAFWGFVVPDRVFPPFQDWFISLAGTLASLLFGLAIWLLFRRSRSSSFRYFGLRAFRFQVYFSLIYYPIFTLIGFIGDWRTIYDFSATPVWSSITAVVHAGMLLLFWQGDRRGWFEMEAVRSVQEKEQLQTLAAAANNSQDAAAQMRYIDTLRRSGATNKAKRLLEQYLESNPNDGTAYLELALLQSDGQRIPMRAVKNAEKALQLGLSGESAASLAHQLLARFNLDMGRLDRAGHHADQALANAKATTDFDRVGLAQVHHLRSLVYRRQRQYDLAIHDVQQALDLARAVENEKWASYYQQDLDVLAGHAKRPS